MGPVLIWIGEKKNQEICGNIWHASMEKPAAFTGVGQLILQIEAVCDREGPAAAEEEPRFLNEQMYRKYRKAREAWSRRPVEGDLMSVLNNRELQGGKAKTLLIADIWSRSHYSMQGTIRGPLTGGKYVGFRSALELMRMIDFIEI